MCEKRKHWFKFEERVLNTNNEHCGLKSCNSGSNEILCPKSENFGVTLHNVVSGAVLQAKSGSSAVNSQNVFSSSRSGCCGRNFE